MRTDPDLTGAAREGETVIPFVDLKAQYRAIKPEIDAAVLETLEEAAFILGPKVASFEKAFAAYAGTTECVGVNSGTSALHVALLAAGVGAGDEVITVPYTFIATVSAICYAGAKPVFVDIDDETFCMDPAKLEAAITPRTKAILPVHLYGHPADMDPILEVARRHGIPVIEDAAQAHGARYRDRVIGSIGAMACFSFYPGKNLGAYGEGGAVTTSDPKHAHTLRLLRNWGQETQYYHDLKAFNYRLEGIQGAVLGVKMKYIEAWTEARRRNAKLYAEAFAGTPVRVPTEAPWARHVYHCYAIRTRNRDEISKALAAAGIQHGIHYPIPVHLQKAHADLGHRKGDFPVSEKAASEVLSLPIYPELTPEQIAEVAGVVKGVAR